MALVRSYLVYVIAPCNRVCHINTIPRHCENTADTFVFVEEIDPRGYNTGSWVVSKDFGNNWIDPLAIWHSKNRGTLGWADGSANMHTWVNQSTIDMAMRAAWGDESVFDMVPPADERDDLRFMQKRYAVLDSPRR